MKIKDIRKKESVQLQKLLAKKRNILRELRFKIAAKQLKNIQEYEWTRRDIAKILTVIREKSIIDQSLTNKE